MSIDRFSPLGSVIAIPCLPFPPNSKDRKVPRWHKFYPRCGNEISCFGIVSASFENSTRYPSRTMDFIMTYRGRAIVFVLFTALSIVYQTERPYAWSIQETLVVNRNRDDVFTAATSEQWIAKFLPFVDSIQRVNEDAPLAKNTLFISRFSIPLYGDIKNTFKVIDHSEGKLFRLFGSSPWLRPVVTVKSKQKGVKTELTVIVTFWRNSILFQATLAPFLWLAHHDSLRQSLLLLRMDLQD